MEYAKDQRRFGKESGIRSVLFPNFIGQTRLIRPLCRLIDGALAKGEPLVSTLLLGPSGFGKTALARAIADKFGTTLVTILARDDITPADLVDRLMACTPFQVVLIDEIHLLRPATQEVLYPLLSEGKLPKKIEPAEKETTGQVVLVAAPRISLIFATNRPGDLRNALHKRCVSRVTLEPYSPEELAGISRLIAARLKLLLTPQAHHELARCSCGCPRVVEHHLLKLRLHYPIVPSQGYTIQQVRQFLREHNIDEHGRDRDQQRLMELLADRGRLSLQTIASALGHNTNHVEQSVEPFLFQRGWITRTPKGRELTEAGRHIVEQTHENELPDDLRRAATG